MLCCLWSSCWRILESIISLLRDLSLWSKNTCLLSLLRNCKWHKYCVISEATGNSHLVKVVKSQCSKVLLLCTRCWFINTMGNVSLSASLWERTTMRRHCGDCKMQEENPESLQPQIFCTLFLLSFRNEWGGDTFFLYWFTLHSGLSSRQD